MGWSAVRHVVACVLILGTGTGAASVWAAGGKSARDESHDLGWAGRPRGQGASEGEYQGTAVRGRASVAGWSTEFDTVGR